MPESFSTAPVPEALISPLALLPVNVLQITVAFCSLLMAAMIWPQRRLHGLLLLLVMYSALMLFNLLEETGVSRDVLTVTPVFSLLLGPVFYLLVRQLAVATAQLRRRDARHAIPGVLLLPVAGQVQIVLALGTVSQLIYLTVAARLLWRYQKTLRAERSDADRLGLQWLIWLLVALAGLVLTDLVRLNLQPYLPFELRNQWYFLHQLLVFALICLLVLRASRQQGFFDGLDASRAAAQNKATAMDDQAQAVFEQLAALIEQQRLYLRPRLAVADLAELTGLGNKDVSWAMNHGAGISFCDYVNQLRLAEVKRKLQQPGRASILEVAFAAGFNSKSTFNSLFKASTGMTPRQYQRRQVQDPDPGRI